MSVSFSGRPPPHGTAERKSRFPLGCASVLSPELVEIDTGPTTGRSRWSRQPNGQLIHRDQGVGWVCRSFWNCRGLLEGARLSSSRGLPDAATAGGLVRLLVRSRQVPLRRNDQMGCVGVTKRVRRQPLVVRDDDLRLGETASPNAPRTLRYPFALQRPAANTGSSSWVRDGRKSSSSPPRTGSLARRRRAGAASSWLTPEGRD